MCASRCDGSLSLKCRSGKVVEVGSGVWVICVGGFIGCGLVKAIGRII